MPNNVAGYVSWAVVSRGFVAFSFFLIAAANIFSFLFVIGIEEKILDDWNGLDARVFDFFYAKKLNAGYVVLLV